MRVNSNKFECALGCHDYCVPNKLDPRILMCTCGRKGYAENTRISFDYALFGSFSMQIHITLWNGEEWWLNRGDKWVSEKPKNWKYEKFM